MRDFEPEQYTACGITIAGMSLDEYKRKRRFEETPEPPPKVESKTGHRFVVQRHDATRLHYDFRLEMEGVLKSWAVPKGPSLDPADKRLAMQVEDHPVSYFDFEGTIPKGNYGGGTVMVWDAGTWEPLSPAPVNGVYVPGTEKEAAAMLAKGDLKFRLKGKRLSGDFALVHIKGRAGSKGRTKGNEWLLIKKKDDRVVAGFDIDSYETSILTGRTLAQIAGDEGSAEWKSSRPASRGRVKAAWLADAIARADAKRKTFNAEDAEKGKNAEDAEKSTRKNQQGTVRKPAAEKSSDPAPKAAVSKSRSKKSSANSAFSASASSALKIFPGAEERPMPTVIHPMLATATAKAFDNPDWLFEIKWDGYRAVAFIDGGRVRLVSRSQNDLTAQFSELGSLPQFVKAERAILDGEIVALDEEGRPSFSLMQQRTGFQPGKRRLPRREGVPVIYYAFDLLYLDGLDLRRVALEQRKQLLQDRIEAGGVIQFSDHYAEKGLALLEAARQRGLEGIVAKKRSSAYVEKRTSDWLKIKITQRQECVIGGYTNPEGSREYFGALVLGLYDRKGRLIHVGQVGTGFDQKTLKEMFARLQPLKTKANPFYGEIGGLRKVQLVRPELVAEIKFAEWTHETEEGGMKLRAPVFMGLRDDKAAEECKLEEAVAS
jgi:bifunctional non-homologous end joining protein LigD